MKRAIARSNPALGVKKRLIITADDFGLDQSVNEAVQQAWLEGALTSTSLMVGAPATADAVEKASRMPGLAVGLHLVLADGIPSLPASEVNLLIDEKDRFDCNMVRAGMRFFFGRRARNQLSREIKAQFEAFRRTGLELDHLNAHKHFHLHPTILKLAITIGQDYGLSAVRIPYEPRVTTALSPWISLMKRSLRKANLKFNDRVIGLKDSGHMNEPAFLEALTMLRPGITEIYCHPATKNFITESMREYSHTAELQALLSRKVLDRIKCLGIEPIAFRDI